MTRVKKRTTPRTDRSPELWGRRGARKPVRLLTVTIRSGKSAILYVAMASIMNQFCRSTQLRSFLVVFTVAVCAGQPATETAAMVAQVFKAANVFPKSNRITLLS